MTAARNHAVAPAEPVPEDNKWQARTAGAFAIEAFHTNWDWQAAFLHCAVADRGIW